ncbi:hypothetical protein LP092_12250 [Moraxella bovis]|nr:hypothetical protein [Moraxella bovis]UZA02706.1 hypothetical protein LP092_12250 [Moraxella bovis]
MKDVPKMIAQSFASYTGKSGDKSTQHLRPRQDRQANWLLFFIVLHVIHLIIALIRFI